MEPKKTRASAQTLKGSKTKAQKRKLPPDPDGLFKRAAARAKKVIAMYDNLAPDVGRDYLVKHLLHDLMHLSDRDPTLGDIGEEYVQAFRCYEKLVKENEWIVGTPDYDSRSGRLKGTPPPSHS